MSKRCFKCDTEMESKPGRTNLGTPDYKFPIYWCPNTRCEQFGRDTY